MVKRYTKKDPYLEREEEKYENPIPSRELIIDYLDEIGRAVTRKHLLEAFDLSDDEKIEALRRRLRAMERDGQIISNRRGQYALVKKLELVRGFVIGRSDGYGFLIPDDGSTDLYLSSYQMRLVFPNDIVLARVSNVDNRGRREGTIVEILERNTHQVVGYYREEGGIFYVEPEKKGIQQIIIIPREDTLEATEGQIVVAEIMAQPTLKRQATGRIIEILGVHMSPGLEVDVAIRSHGLPYLWSPEVLAETKMIPQEVQEQEILHRKDLRKYPFVTIDGEDARDFDDAVFCLHAKNFSTLYVAIADVGHYLKTETALDQEAHSRGNSVYFPNRVIPMLPEELSNGICSLKPQVDRLCMVCEMKIDTEGKLQDYRFYEAVIKSHARLTYTEVAEMIEGKKTEHHVFLPQIKQIYKAYKNLKKQRLLRGALDFDTVETKIIYGKDKKILKIIPAPRNEAHRLIEECMLIANVAAAEFLERQGAPLLYRVHKPPDQEKLENLRSFLHGASLKLSGKRNPNSQDYAKLLKKIEGRPDAHVIQTRLLRSLKQAIYSPINEGHFGLAYEKYTHFTSPIRRFPDVITHRALKSILQKKETVHFHYNAEQLMLQGDHLSMTERRADEATRDVVDWLKCEYMLDKVGEEFEGVISEVTGFGIFVELKNIFVEGLVHITALKSDYYHYDPISRTLVGKKTRVAYTLGDTVTIKVVRVDLDQKKMDFDLVGVHFSIGKKVRQSKRRR